MLKGKRVTLNDVADRSGVSYQTVSRVVNNHPSVALETRARVLKIIDELDYRPNRAARSLASKRSSTIGIIVFGTGYYGPTQMVLNIEQALRARGYSLTISTVDEMLPEKLHDAVSHLESQSVDGIVMITPIRELGLEIMAKSALEAPCVMIDVPFGWRVPSVVIDQAYGARLATCHLIELGHRQIAEISGPLSWYGAEQRHQSWLATLREHGLEPGLSQESDWTAAGGFLAVQKLLERNGAFTAVFVGNDQMALGAIRAFREAGLRVPEDISVVGFDDVPEAAYFDPPLTTIRQDFLALGQQSVEYLITLLNASETPPHQRVLYPKLIERSSTRKWV